MLFFLILVATIGIQIKTFTKLGMYEQVGVANVELPLLFHKVPPTTKPVLQKNKMNINKEKNITISIIIG